jgi:CRP-like cAMP-binding protein
MPGTGRRAVTVFQEAEMLRQVPLFEKVDLTRLKLIAFTSRAMRYAAGEVVMQKNEVSDCAFVILEGEVEVVGETAEGEFVVARFGRNSLVGEMSLLLDAPRVATVRATTPVRALRIAGDQFLRLLCENPSCSLHVMRLLSTRLTRATRRVEELTGKLQEAGNGDAVT